MSSTRTDTLFPYSTLVRANRKFAAVEVGVACVDDVDIVALNGVFASARRRLRRVDGLGLGKCFGLKRLVFVNDGTGVVGQCPACVRGRVADQVFGSARAYDPSARIAAFRAQIDNPVGRADDVQIVFDDQQGMRSEEHTSE